MNTAFISNTFTDDSRYFAWRAQKLSQYPLKPINLMVEINNPQQLTATEYALMHALLKRYNMVLYRVSDPAAVDKNSLVQLGAQLGLQRIDTTLCAEEDGISALQVANAGHAQEYIPYSNQALNWHTDGYYNAPDQQVHALLMYCTRPAASGGDNCYVDHELAYIHLRDTNPAFIPALMQAGVMTIPANIQNGSVIRAENTGPVFAFTANGQLHMRYTARKRYIHWLADDTVQAAIHCLTDFLASDSPYHVYYRLAAGEGVICNNILHNRSGFTDGETMAEQRLIYRIRYYDRVG